VPIDALVFSDADALEREATTRMTPTPGLIVATRGAAGGGYASKDGTTGSWNAVEPPGPVVDSYGAGDSFAGALCWALAAGLEPAAAVAVAARAGATCLMGRGPYERQLGRDEAERAAREA
jgi:ribokinase